MSTEPGGRERLIDAAERLIAQHGTAVPLRRIIEAAEQRNATAVQYHFGSRDGLIAAVIATRQEVFESGRQHRIDVLEARAGIDAEAWVRALLEPVFEHQRRASPGWHGRFMEKVRDHPGLTDRPWEQWPATRLIAARLAALDPDDDLRDLRLRGLASLTFALLADLERDIVSGADGRDRAEDTAVELITRAMTPRALARPSD